MTEVSLKITVLSWDTHLVTVNNINSCALSDPLPTILCTLLPMTSKADKLPLETEPAALDNNMIFTVNLVTELSSHLTQLLKVKWGVWSTDA